MLLARAVRAVNDLTMSIAQHPASKSAPTSRTVWSVIFRKDRRVWLWRSLVLAAGASAAAIGFLTAGHPYSPLPPGTPSPHVSWISAISGCFPGSNTAAADGIVYVTCVKTEQSTAPAPVFTPTLSPTSSPTLFPTFSPTTSPDLQNHSLYAMNADNGHIRWIRPLGSYSSSPAVAVAVANGFVYIGAGDGGLYALDPATGRTRWSYKTGSPVSSGPTVAGGTLYFGNNKGWMYALNAINGHARWTVPLAGVGGIGTSPAVAGNTAYVVVGSNSSSSSKLYAVNVANGHIRWVVGGSFTSGPAVAGGMIYVSGDQLYAFDAANGHIKWTSRTEWLFSTDPAVESGTVYIGSSKGTLYAFSAATGQLRWSYATVSFYNSSINEITSAIVANNTVYVAGFEIEYALNADNGGIRWAYYNQYLYFINGNPAVLQGAVYLTSDDAMYALSQ